METKDSMDKRFRPIVFDVLSWHVQFSDPHSSFIAHWPPTIMGYLRKGADRLREFAGAFDTGFAASVYEV